MAKKYTFMILHSGNVQTITINRNLIIAVIALFFFLIIGVGLSAYLLSKYSGQRSGLYADANIPEHTDIESQLELYNTQIQEIATKINTIDDLEYRIRDLVALQDGHTPLKPVAVGGKEVDLLRDYSSAAALSEKDFFDNLNNTLQQLSKEVAKRELSLSELTATLEEKRLVMLYTPTMWPVRGWVSSNFGYRLSPFTGRQTFHEGMDIAARYNTDVKATASGVVVFAGPKAGYGFLVAIDHGYGYMTRYGHNSALSVRVGDRVERGQVVAKVGSTGQSTGPHVHYEVLVNGIPVNPIKFIIDDVLAGI